MSGMTREELIEESAGIWAWAIDADQKAHMAAMVGLKAEDSGKITPHGVYCIRELALVVMPLRTDTCPDCEGGQA